MISKVRSMQNSWSHFLAMRRGVNFCVVITQIIGSWSPINKELALVAPILDLIESHIYSLWPFLLDGFVCKTNSCCIVHLNIGGRLGVSHFFQSHSDRKAFLCIQEACSYFSFRRRCHHRFKNFADDTNGTVDVVFWRMNSFLRVITEKEMASDPASALGNR